MTFIRPHTAHSLAWFLGALTGGLLVAAGCYIFTYNGIAATRYRTSELKQEMTQLEAKNTDLKNQYFALIDAGKLQAAAATDHLVLEEHPTYFSQNQWLSDSSRF